jgi:hypothetical protein
MAPPPVTPVFNYGGNINILETSRAYRREVELCLKLIETTPAGRTLIRHIKARSSRRLLIIPYRPNAEDGWVNAFAAADTFLDSMPKGSFYVGTYDLVIPNLGTIPIPHAWQGTGTGSPVTLKFHPATFHQYNKTHGGVPPGSGAGEILFHEMVHGLQQMEGKLVSDSVAENQHMDTFTEFCAIVAANVYRSERGFTSLRADHHGFTKLGKHTTGQDLTDPRTYASVYAEPLKKWRGLQPLFYGDLAASSARFNPLKYI